MIRKKISIITPCFNEEECIEECYTRVKKLFETDLKDYDYEHIFADNFSTDSTIQKLKKIAIKDNNIKIILNSRNFGIFRSTFNAIKRANGDAVIPKLDADLQDPPELIKEFITLWEQNYNVVAGRRKDRDENFIMKSIRKIYYRIITNISEFYIPPDVGEYQLLDKKVVHALLQFDDYNPYIRGLIANCGFETKIINYTHAKRHSGKSKYNLFSYFNIFLNGMISSSAVPMRSAVYIGFILSGASILYSLYLFSLPVLFGKTLDNAGMMTLLVAVFFFSGIIILFLGILGEYVSAIHSQVRKGPHVFERELINFDEINKNKH